MNHTGVSKESVQFHRENIEFRKKFACSKQALMARTEFMARNKPICR